VLPVAGVSAPRRAPREATVMAAAGAVHAQERYARELVTWVPECERWLDLGCGRQLLPDWALSLEEQRRLTSRARRIVGVDLDRALFENRIVTHRVVGSGYELPFASECFDVVTANMVVEHIDAPGRLLAEIARVLRPAGRLIVHTTNRLHPFFLLAGLVPGAVKQRIVSRVDTRAEEDIFPTRYRMNTTRRIRALAERHGFDVLSLNVCGSVGFVAHIPVLRAAERPMLHLLETRPLRRFRSNILAVLAKQPDRGQSTGRMGAG
jgi:ubiquinone/menaquinone biosynthesis C-methylase UbiE